MNSACACAANRLAVGSVGADRHATENAWQTTNNAHLLANRPAIAAGSVRSIAERVRVMARCRWIFRWRRWKCSSRSFRTGCSTG